MTRRPGRGLLADATGDVMLVGHLPHLAKLASLLLTGEPDRQLIGFQQGGLVAMEHRDAAWIVALLLTPSTAVTCAERHGRVATGRGFDRLTVLGVRSPGEVSSGEAVQHELWVFNVEDFDVGEPGVFGVTADGVGTHHRAGLRLCVAC